MLKTNKTGFTLVELLVVIAIIGLLSTIAVVSLGSARGKARDTKRVADAKQIMTALEQYYNDNNGYPYATPTGASGGQLLGGGVICTTATAGLGVGSGLTCTGSTYMGNVPTYPTPGPSGVSATCSTTAYASLAAADANRSSYCYFTSSASGVQSNYALLFVLENVNSALGSGARCTMTPSGTTCS